MAVSWIVVLQVLAGVAIGIAAGLFASPARREAKRLRQQLDGAILEHDSYKTSVQEHFRKTADLVGNLTRSYAAVYDHLATGARSFCSDAGSDSLVALEPLPPELEPPVVEPDGEPPVMEPPVHAEIERAAASSQLQAGA